MGGRELQTVLGNHVNNRVVCLAGVEYVVEGIEVRVTEIQHLVENDGYVQLGEDDGASGRILLLCAASDVVGGRLGCDWTYESDGQYDEEKELRSLNWWLLCSDAIAWYMGFLITAPRTSHLAPA
ncbi:hypothetical protein CPLU01_15853 [Colletotrichum plurivorum]|uniref:Uncharacterized protein n=1 Tax=Colletotrichum plurivorum TaxID=2175906 RepID=A0A8H6MSU0_9PEZI|nr:hypothetical protein CPLU01_15853 [Colletotrichum plurivorum]